MSDLFPSFEPDPGRSRLSRLNKIPLRLLIPNLITLIALCAGLTAIRLALEGKLELAVGAIVMAAVLDGVDGRVARLLKGTSRFGAELDSLADFVNFGVVPAIVLYFWGLSALSNLGWLAVLTLAICAALRLARFNVMLDDPSRPVWAANFFVGMPAPAGAIAALLPIYLSFLGVPKSGLPPVVVATYILVIALLMVSKIPTFSGKKLGTRVPREWVLLVFLAGVLLVAMLVAYPWEILSLFTLIYLASIPYGAWHYRQLETRYAADETLEN